MGWVGVRWIGTEVWLSFLNFTQLNRKEVTLAKSVSSRDCPQEARDAAGLLVCLLVQRSREQNGALLEALLHFSAIIFSSRVVSGSHSAENHPP